MDAECEGLDKNKQFKFVFWSMVLLIAEFLSCSKCSNNYLFLAPLHFHFAGQLNEEWVVIRLLLGILGHICRNLSVRGSVDCKVGALYICRQQYNSWTTVEWCVGCYRQMAPHKGTRPAT